ncbi:zinc ribbon domain-containing protein [Lapillicoccus jejuensis]|uniref:Uncharacterized protein n=1 Tax=Lapillicoccus jejuensis TaxID=402171 RepID=A0A542DWU6_9MICO|nr:zinc ribbon domain-containing protein [Lapillicoccus jejuensis]TQJ07548.1 hypothetical protein FB458_0613 [Lapillicoccus jejuensis]
MTPLTTGDEDEDGTTMTTGVRTCPQCGTERIEGALFCEACAHDFTADDLAAGVTPPAPAEVPAAGHAQTEPTPAATLAGTPQAAPPGQESPLDVGWTGPTVVGEAAAPQSGAGSGPGSAQEGSA